MAGVLLWRGGLVFVAGHVCYLGAWQLIQRLNWPVQVTAGLALSLTGLALALYVFVQVPLASWWLARHDLGPAEALWRRLSYPRSSTPAPHNAT